MARAGGRPDWRRGFPTISQDRPGIADKSLEINGARPFALIESKRILFPDPFPDRYRRG